MKKRDVVIVSACRTPIGAFGGSLRPVQAPQLASLVMREAIKRAKLQDQLDLIQDVRFGNCLEPVDAMNVTRIAALLAGVPNSVPAVTVNRVCISGMTAALDSMVYIQNGLLDCCLVGGVESMSNVPYVVQEARWGLRLQDAAFADGLIRGLQCGSIFVPYPKDGPVEWARGKPFIMGQTAEFLVARDGWTREQQDEIALRSHNNAERANTDGTFKDEIVPVTIKDRKKGEIIVDKDEHFRPGLTMEQLARLSPAFIPNGTVTAGNSSGINDGASAMIIMAEETALELGLKPLAKITGMGMGACEPEIMGRSPVPAVRNLLERTDYKIEQFERIELNEAFAAQYLTVEKELGLNRDITNINGSGIGLGHPVGCTGNRIMVSLLYELIHSGKQTGLATLCGGGGVSSACVLEKM
ncbi:MAG: acetyl-CoA C-acyltransferase [Candidatus Lokiarchaeota archaeon]|nr:acetyl-CoA C-acyltransferase [Candidatus Lokiarchaeota archaeon]